MCDHVEDFPLNLLLSASVRLQMKILQYMYDFCSCYVGIDNGRTIYIKVNMALKTLLTMPVSTATPERTFSALRRTKTWLRNTMTQGRLSSLAMLHIHRDRKPDTDMIIRQFAGNADRRLALVFDNWVTNYWLPFWLVTFWLTLYWLTFSDLYNPLRSVLLHLKFALFCV